METVITILLTIHCITGLVYCYDLIKVREDVRKKYAHYESSIKTLIHELNKNSAALNEAYQVISKKDHEIAEMNQHITAMNAFNKDRAGAVQ